MHQGFGRMDVLPQVIQSKFLGGRFTQIPLPMRDLQVSE